MTGVHSSEMELYITLQAFYLRGGQAERKNGINYKTTIYEVELGPCLVGKNLNSSQDQYDSFNFKSSFCP
jgi:hypothetical protein